MIGRFTRALDYAAVTEEKVEALSPDFAVRLQLISSPTEEAHRQ